MFDGAEEKVTSKFDYVIPEMSNIMQPSATAGVGISWLRPYGLPLGNRQTLFPGSACLK